MLALTQKVFPVLRIIYIFFSLFLNFLNFFFETQPWQPRRKPNKENSLNPASILQPLIFSHQTREVIKQSRRGSGQRGEDGVWENTTRRIQVSWQCRHFHGRLHLGCSGSHAALAAHNTQRTGLNFQMTKKNSGGGERNLTLWKRHLYFNLQLIEEIALLHWERKKKKLWIARLSHHLTLFTLNGARGFEIPQHYLVFFQFRTSAVVILSMYKSRLQTVSAV